MDANLTTENAAHPAADATVCVERSDGIRYTDTRYVGNGVYTISNARLDTALRYRLHIDLDGESYESEYLAPLTTPDIDSLSWVKRGAGEPVYICVSTHDTHDRSRCYRWTYREIWEFQSELFAQRGQIGGEGPSIDFDLNSSLNTYYCWGRDQSKIMVLENVGRLSENAIREKRLVAIPPADEKLSRLYYIAVRQYQIRTAAYAYYENLQKNISQTGSMFTPVPFEMQGNIRCLTHPGKPVIGYVEVSTSAYREQFMPELTTEAYEPPEKLCNALFIETYLPPAGYVRYTISPPTYGPARCLDCMRRGTKNKPAFWPTPHL